MAEAGSFREESASSTLEVIASYLVLVGDPRVIEELYLAGLEQGLQLASPESRGPVC